MIEVAHDERRLYLLRRGMVEAGVERCERTVALTLGGKCSLVLRWRLTVE